MFSKDVLQRSTYPFERDTAESLPDWGRFYDHVLDAPVPALEGPAADAMAVLDQELFEAVPYALPFRRAAAHFLMHVVGDVRPYVASENLSAVLAEIGRWHVDRMRETARFVLHLSYMRSGLGYRDWGHGFSRRHDAAGGWLDVACEFPVLIRWLAVLHDNAAAAMRELFGRLAADRADLQNLIRIPIDVPVVSLTPGLSDPHKEGRTVIRLRFAGGTSVIYKPKPLQIDAALYDFLAETQSDFGVQPLKVLSRDHYGWVEDVSRHFGTPPGQGTASNMGKASACFWLLNATDLHSENIVATADGIFALDLETLLLPYSKDAPFDPAASWRTHSVYTTLLFDVSFGEKVKQNISGFNPSPDLSFMGPELVFTFQGDEVVMGKSDPKAVRPANGGSIADHPLALAGGLTKAASEKARRRLSAFLSRLPNDCVTRIVVRDTYFYARLLDRMRQPRHLRDGAVLYADLMTLHKGVADAGTRCGVTHRLVDDEIRQLLNGDIPYFSAEAGGYALLLSEGEIDGFFKMSGKQTAQAKIDHLDASDVAEQIALTDVAASRYAPKSAAVTDEPLPEKLASLFDSIASSAFRPKAAPARWISMFGDVSGQESRVDVGDPGFFAGSWGILLALEAAHGAMGVVTGRERREELLDAQARLWCEQTARQSDVHNGEAQGPIGFSGIAGELFAKQILLGRSPDRWGFLESHIEAGLRRGSAAIAGDRWLDVIGGSAGFGLVCNYIRSQTDIPRIRAAAEEDLWRAGRHLVDRATPHGNGCAWSVPAEDRPLMGYAHGWSGIVTAIECARRLAPSAAAERRLAGCLGRAVTFSSSVVADRGEWRDDRGGDREGTPLNRSWCNGIPGILRGHYAVRGLWDDVLAGEVARRERQLADAFGSADVCRLCCGEMGNADVLMDVAGGRTGLAVSDSELEAVIGHIVTGFLAPDPSDPPEKLFPGLFHGRAGILYTAARFLDPALPSLSGQPRHSLTEVAAVAV